MELSPKKRAVLSQIATWFVFAVILALLPIIVNALGAVTRGEKIAFVPLLGHGELLLVSAAVVGASLTNLMDRDSSKLAKGRLWTGVFGAIVVLMASLWFADVAGALHDGSSIDNHSVAVGSCIVFFFALVAGLSCVVIGELARD
jgi:heme/copper-type cytochrome/quinol oxidase subunit 3